MAKKFWVNTGHTLMHAGQYLIHACEEVPEEIVSMITKVEGNMKRFLDAGAVVEERPQVNPATDRGAPSQQDTFKLRPVTTSQSQAGPSLPPVLGEAAELPPPPGGAAPKTDATGKPVAPVTAGLTR